MEMSAAAPPPTPLKMATICGIAVILTRRAAGTAIDAPDHHGHQGQDQVEGVGPDDGVGEGEAHGHERPRPRPAGCRCARAWVSSGP